MKTWFKRSIKVLLGLFVIYLLHLNIALYYSPTFKKNGNSVYNSDLYAQLQHLKKQIDQGADIDMQKLYPEGFCFVNLLYGLSWVNFAKGLDKDNPLFLEALPQIDRGIEAMLSPRARLIFSPKLPLSSGAFYNSWTAYLIGKKMEIAPKEHWDEVATDTFKNFCHKIASALRQNPHPYLESYASMAWPADMMPGIAALQIHDRLFEAQYQEDIARYLREIKTLLDPKTGLVPHSVHPESGKSAEGAMGSSQSLMLIFLKELDPDFGKEQFKRYKELFLAHRFGLPGIREYPKGSWGGMHVDSGPVLLGIGGAASLVGQYTMALYGENDYYCGLRNSIEGFGMAYTWFGKKKYVGGFLAVADAFIAWSNSAENQQAIVSSYNWRWGFQLLSFFLVLLSVFVIWKWRK